MSGQIPCITVEVERETIEPMRAHRYRSKASCAPGCSTTVEALRNAAYEALPNGGAIEREESGGRGGAWFAATVVYSEEMLAKADVKTASELVERCDLESGDESFREEVGCDTRALYRQCADLRGDLDTLASGCAAAFDRVGALEAAQRERHGFEVGGYVLPVSEDAIPRSVEAVCGALWRAAIPLGAALALSEALRVWGAQ